MRRNVSHRRTRMLLWPRFLVLLLCAPLLAPAPAGAADSAYIGSKQCAQCHPRQYDTFQQHSRKARSWHSVSVMAPKLTPDELQSCYACHTTGYGKGGFKDYESTPQFADVGCETCHGPGAAHAESGDPASIQRLPSREDCLVCHNENRVKAFNFKPLIHSGAH